jgi:DUF4097 and DUF4098 domain-containing protein YvlB
MNARGVVLIGWMGVLLPAAATADTWREQSRQTIPGPGLTQITVQNARGRIEARPSPDLDLHVVALKIVRGSSTEAAKDLARQTAVELQREGSRYLIRVRYPKSQSIHVNVWEDLGNLSVPKVEVQLTLQVPSRVALDMSSSSGDLASQDLAIPQSLRTSSGEVSVAGAAGRISVNTASGDITLTDARAGRIATASGNVEVQGAAGVYSVATSSGDVTIDAASDSLWVESTSGDVVVRKAGHDPGVRTSSGDVTLRGASGKISVTTVSGEVEAQVSPPLTGANISSSSGDVRVGLQSRVACRLELHTSSGTIEINGAIRPETLTRRLVTGTVGSGSAPVMVHSSSGSITVSSGGS